MLHHGRFYFLVAQQSLHTSLCLIQKHICKVFEAHVLLVLASQTRTTGYNMVRSGETISFSNKKVDAYEAVRKEIILLYLFLETKVWIGGEKPRSYS